MIEAAEAGELSLDKLEAMTAVCSVGLDMVALPGDTPAEIRHVALLAITTWGFPTAIAGLGWIEEVLGHAEER